MTEKLKLICENLVREKEKSRRKRKLKYAGFGLLVFIFSPFFYVKLNTAEDIEICYVSKQKKEYVKKRIDLLSEEVETLNKVQLYSLLKKELAYENINKMKCRQYGKALAILNRVEVKILTQ